MSRLIIGSDLDGTLADHSELKQRIARRFGFECSLKECASDLMRSKIPHEIYSQIKHEVYGEASVSSPVMPGAREAITWLEEEFGPLTIISRRKYEDGDFARAWLRTHFIPPLKEENVFFVERDEHKDTVALQKDIALYIDDKPETLDKMPSIARRVLMDPFDSFPESPYPRVHSWAEFVALAKRI